MPQKLREPEFIALMAMLFATIAFSVDSMLPAMPEIAAELTPLQPNRAQLIITSFVLGMGLGTLVTGPLSDAYGRKPVILFGMGLYCMAAIAAIFANSLEMILAARVVQGMGAAAPRVVALAIIRDQYEGRRMARLMSLVFIVFSLVPALAPSLGQAIIWTTGWRGIFAAFVVFAVLSSLWLALRQPETLPVAQRRPFRFAPLLAGIKEILAQRTILLSILALSFCFGTLFAALSATQQVFDQTFGMRDSFPLWFALVAVLSATSAVVNARLVERLGMRYLARAMFIAQIGISLTTLCLFAFGNLPHAIAFALFFVWLTGAFFQAGMTIGNLNTVAMEPLPHLAGMTASVVGSIATVLGVFLAVPVGLAFNGTPVPLIMGTLVYAVLALCTMLAMGKR